MDRKAEEANYVLENLCRARQEVIAHPELFEPDSLERIERALAAIEKAQLADQAA